MPIENRREVERLDDSLNLYLRIAVPRQTIMQLDRNSRHALLAERHQHAPSHHRLHAWRDGVGEDHVERYGKGDVAEERHYRG